MPTDIHSEKSTQSFNQLHQNNGIICKDHSDVSFNIRGKEQRYDGFCRHLDDTEMLLESVKKLSPGTLLDMVLPTDSTDRGVVKAKAKVITVESLPTLQGYLAGISIIKISV